MSHFEYISVATALMYAMLAGRLLSGLSPCLNESRRYPTHVAWIFALLLVCVMQWWVFWLTSQVTWTPTRFLWALALPAVVFVRAGVLIGEDPSEVASFRDHFFRRRVRFFSLGVVSSAQAALSPWIFGIVPWLTPAPIHRTAALLATLSVAGIAFESSRAHAVIVFLTLLLAVSTFYLVPAMEPVP